MNGRKDSVSLAMDSSKRLIVALTRTWQKMGKSKKPGSFVSISSLVNGNGPEDSSTGSGALVFAATEKTEF
jgi:hypothetical protein